jgi:hypothetical protein
MSPTSPSIDPSHSRIMPPKRMRFWRLIGLCAGVGLAASAQSGVIRLNTFLQFSFADPGTFTTGCVPENPRGDLCLTLNPATQFSDIPELTFAAPAGSATPIVVDAVAAGEPIQVFDLGSLPVGGGSCGVDSLACLVGTSMSRVVSPLLPGPHSVNLLAALSPSAAGSGFLPAQTLPEPGILALLAVGLLSLWGWHKRRRRK